MKLNLVRNINLVENNTLIAKLNKLGIMIFSAILLFVGVPFYSKLIANAELFFEFANRSSNWLKLLAFNVGKGLITMSLFFFASLILHELIHGMFFKLFGGGKLKFGLEKGMLYASTPSSLYPAWQFLLIAVAPFLFISSFYALLGLTHPFFALLLFALHSSGCIGDFYFIYVIITSGRQVWVKDTDVGIAIYQKRGDLS